MSQNDENSKSDRKKVSTHLLACNGNLAASYQGFGVSLVKTSRASKIHGVKGAFPTALA